MKLKKLVITFFIFILFLLIVGTLYFYTNDIKSFDDSDLAIISKEEINLDGTQNKKLELAIKSLISIESISNTQSAYIADLYNKKRRSFLNEIGKFNEDFEIGNPGSSSVGFDLHFAREYLKVNKTSLRLADELLKENFVLHTPKKHLARNATLEYQITELQNLLKIKSIVELADGDLKGFNNYLSKMQTLTQVLDNSSNNIIEGIMAIKSKQLLAIFVNDLLEHKKISKYIMPYFEINISDLRFNNAEKCFVGEYYFLTDALFNGPMEEKSFLMGIKDPLFLNRNATALIAYNNTKYFLNQLKLPYTNQQLLQMEKSLHVKGIKKNSMGLEIALGLLKSHLLLLKITYANHSKIALLETSLAIKKYKLKYNKIPGNLEQLIPEFLKNIPTDPFDQKPIKYSSTEQKIWTIGSTLKDTEGKPMLKKNEGILILN